MIAIIHGSHRKGYCWEIVKALHALFEEHCIEAAVVDLSSADILPCCGNQVCQEGACIYLHDDFSETIKNQILYSDGIYIVTPTYFNMPPAKLKNFIDRTNALLPIVESIEKKPFFGAYVCGEADIESIENNLRLLSDYAEIMGWNSVGRLNTVECITDTSALDIAKITEIVNCILAELQLKGE